MSSDRQLAAALGPHPQVAQKAQVIFYDQAASSFVSATTAAQLLSRNDIIAAVRQSSLPLPAGAKLDVTQDDQVLFSMSSFSTSFSLQSPQDFALFAELVAMTQLVVPERTSPATGCDLISIGVASIRVCSLSLSLSLSYLDVILID
jgi:hypothetical protein